MLCSGRLALQGQSCCAGHFIFRSLKHDRPIHPPRPRAQAEETRPQSGAAEFSPASIRRHGIQRLFRLASTIAKPPPFPPPALTANRANALHSTGPRTDPGKARLPSTPSKPASPAAPFCSPLEDAAEYERHLAAFRDEYQPVGLRECELVQSIADTCWRLARIPCLEMAIFAKGRIEFANLFDEHELAARPHLIDAHTFLVYEKQIRNLQLQEARLVRRREKETAELRKLQAERMQNAELIQKEDTIARRRPPMGSNFQLRIPEPFRSPRASLPPPNNPFPVPFPGPIITHQAA